jgi:hypothetical protein
VVALVKGKPRPIWNLSVREVGASGHARLTTVGVTEEHPWRTSAGAWVETRDLSPGTRLVSAGGARVVVVSLKNTNHVEATYNFEVADFHTYFVGPEGLWVHNSCAPEKFAKQMAKRIEKALGKNARNKFHDAKVPGAGDRTKQELIDDAREIFGDYGVPIPPWLR